MNRVERVLTFETLLDKPAASLTFILSSDLTQVGDNILTKEGIIFAL